MSEPVSLVSQEYDPAVPLGRLTPHPANPNEGDRGLVGELLEANGFAGAVLAQKSTGLLIDGEHRWRAAGDKNMDTIPVLWVDVDDETRDRLLASLNESTRRGHNNEAKLVALLQGFTGTPKGLDGTAFDGDDLDDLIKSLNGPPPGGGPPEDGPGETSWGVVIQCEDEAGQSALLTKLASEGYPVRALGVS